MIKSLCVHNVYIDLIILDWELKHFPNYFASLDSYALIVVPLCDDSIQGCICARVVIWLLAFDCIFLLSLTLLVSCARYFESAFDRLLRLKSICIASDAIGFISHSMRSTYYCLCICLDVLSHRCIDYVVVSDTHTIFRMWFIFTSTILRCGCRFLTWFGCWC